MRFRHRRTIPPMYVRYGAGPPAGADWLGKILKWAFWFVVAGVIAQNLGMLG